MWLPRDNPSLFVAGTTPDTSVLPPEWHIVADRVDFRELRASPLLTKRERCIRGGSMHIAAAFLGIANSNDGVSGWDLQSFNMNDPVEVALIIGGAMRVCGSPRCEVNRVGLQRALGPFRDLVCLPGYPSLSSTDRRDYGGYIPPVSVREVFYFSPHE